MIERLITIRNFIRGFVTSYGRGKQPEGSFQDSRNLLPTKKGSLEQAHGYSTTDGLSALPTAFTEETSGSDTRDMSSIEWHPFPFSLEQPVAHDGYIWFMQDDEAENHYLIKPWYRGSTMDPTSGGTTAQSQNSGFAIFDERKRISYTTDVNLASVGASSTTFTVANASTHGLSTTNDFYNGWKVGFYDDTGGDYEYAYIKDYSVSGGTATFTLNENIGSSNLNWTVWTTNDYLIFRRWFHSVDEFNNDPAAIATFSGTPGQPFESEGRIRGCGGASSNENHFPWVAQYFDRTYWSGHANTFRYQGTYIDKMECTQHGNSNTAIAVVAAGSTPYRDNTTAAEPQNFPDNYTYYVGWTLEYDGHEESRLGDFDSLGSTGASNTYDRAYFSLDIYPAQVSRRVTAINIYVIEEVSGVRSQPKFVRRYDILSPTSAELDATNGWQWNTAGGFFEIDGGAGENREAYFTYLDVLNSTGTYYQRTGRLQELDADLAADSTRHIVNWQEATQVAGRALFGNFYDPNTPDTYVDQIRFTPITSSGVPNYDIIPAERDVYEKDVATGDPGVVRRLEEQNGYLIVFKDDSIYSFYITPTPETWSPQTLSRRDGLVSRDSVVKLPNGDIGFADVDFYKVIRNGDVFPVTWNWEDDYFALTKTSIVAWYDKIDSSLRITDQQTVSSEYPIYCAYPHLEYRDESRLVFPWYQVRVPHKVEFVSQARDESVLFTNGSATVAYVWHSTDKTFAGTSIKPYLKTHPHVIDEGAHMAIDHVRLTRENNTGYTGTLQNYLYVDSPSTPTTTFASVTGADLFSQTQYQKVRPTEKRMGRKVQFEYNINATPETNPTNNIILHEIAFIGRAVKPRKLNR